MSTFSDSRRAGVRDALAAAVSLVFPTWCAGCDALDTTLCATCRARLDPVVTRRAVGALAVSSGLVFDGVAARVLRAAKEDNRTPLLRALAPALAAAVAAALAQHPVEAIRRPVALVPIPSSPAAMRRRGYRVVEVIAGRAGFATHRLLRTNGAVADQRRLGLAERARNVDGSMRVARPANVAGRAVLIVDDVVTTGATLREAARALTEAGADVIGAATVASTPRTGIVTGTHT